MTACADFIVSMRELLNKSPDRENPDHLGPPGLLWLITAFCPGLSLHAWPTEAMGQFTAWGPEHCPSSQAFDQPSDFSVYQDLILGP